MTGFKRITDGIFSLQPTAEASAPLVFVTGKNNFLIDCGCSVGVIDYCLAPALRKIGYNMKNIHYAVFTHCGSETVGGAHRLRAVAPDVHFLAFGCQADKLKNPTFYETNIFSVCPDFAPPLREISGIFVDGEADPDSIILRDLTPVAAPGHDSDCVCWYHRGSKTLICGESVQGDGTDRTGCAVITDPSAYRSSLSALSELDIETMLCSSGFRGVPAMIQGRAQCLGAIHNSLAAEESYEKFAEEYVNSRRSQQLPVTLEDLTVSYFASRGSKPAFYGYSMLTFYQYIKNHL